MRIMVREIKETIYEVNEDMTDSDAVFNASTDMIPYESKSYKIQYEIIK